MKKLKFYTNLYNEICCAYEDSYWNAQNDLKQQTEAMRYSLINITNSTKDVITKERMSHRLYLLEDMLTIKNHIPVTESVLLDPTATFIIQVADTKGYEIAMQTLKAQFVTHLVAIEDLAHYTTDEETKKLILGTITELYKIIK